MEEIKKILIISSDKNLREVLNFCFDGWGYEVFLWDHLDCDLTPIKKISPDVIVLDVHCAHKAQLEICRLLKDEVTTIFIPIITLINKRQLRRQLLNLKYGVDDYLIKPPDPLDLRVRVEMAIKRAQYSFYASPLTRLPGGRVVEEALRERLKKRDCFSFGYVDIDNFKSFNDAYGYIKGDSVLIQTAYMLYITVKKFGNKDDFIGHIGGDDFVFITTPERYKQICENFILMFDKIIPFHYSLEDRNRMFIITKDRTNKIKKISLMSVSIAVVNREDVSNFANLIEINDKVVEIKSYLKTIPGSKFMAERREYNTGFLTPQIYKKEEAPLNSYKPLGQILLERNLISSEHLDDALRIHWKRDVILGEILKELGFLKEEKLQEALNNQMSKEVESRENG